jgi:hypothetical protein
MNPIMQLDLAENQREKELNVVKGYEATASSLIYTVPATQPDI